MTNLTY